MPYVTNDLLHTYRLYEYFIRRTGGGSKSLFWGEGKGGRGASSNTRSFEKKVFAFIGTKNLQGQMAPLALPALIKVNSRVGFHSD